MLNLQGICDECDGTGSEDGMEHTCDACQGQGTKSLFRSNSSRYGTTNPNYLRCLSGHRKDDFPSMSSMPRD